MTVNDPVLLAEMTAAFAEYERALMADDLPAMDALFHDAPTTNRFGVGEVLWGMEAIREFRKGRGGSPQRRLGHVAIAVYGGCGVLSRRRWAARAAEPELGEVCGWVEGRFGACQP